MSAARFSWPQGSASYCSILEVSVTVKSLSWPLPIKVVGHAHVHSVGATAPLAVTGQAVENLPADLLPNVRLTLVFWASQ
jgi:hypothetical protein